MPALALCGSGKDRDWLLAFGDKLLRAGLQAIAALWPTVALMYAWVWRAAHILGVDGPDNAMEARRQLGGLLGAMTRHDAKLGALAVAAAHFVRDSCS